MNKDRKTKIKPMVSIILPVYNLSGIIEESLTRITSVLDKTRWKYEVIVVDDGSKDNTFQKAKNIAIKSKSKIRVYRLPHNMGKGFAQIYGFRKSRGNIIVFFDGDLDINVKQIPLLINKLIENPTLDVIITSKWHPKSKTKATPLRKFLSKSFSILVKTLLRLPVTDTQTGAKAFRREVLEKIANRLTVKRYAFDAELLTASVMNNFRIGELPALWEIKITSKFKTKEIIKMFLDLLAITYRKKIKKQYIST